ncbi:hypothetical protein [Aeoliella mucimassa]|uniref:Uncharacterized protein n=1 Tax=Aeoliella mucimassa TaxID=2527972 RepID=A0A518AV62_9BACT|nr:hypothetical protein [Aeoliella mucimassa]QDU58606.1 hypothetical protein Pan181_48450 [Aeoliella mucimassa]
MSHFCDRREFATRMAALLASVSVPVFEFASAEQAANAPQRLVRLGINALARAPELNYFNDGHRGAAMISAHMMCTDNEFDDAAVARIGQLFDLNWANSKLCQPYPDGDPVPDAAAQVGKALAAGGTLLRQVGHDAIFAMHAIKAFEMMPELATPERTAGVCRLIRSFKPWRDVEPDPEVDPPPFAESAAAARFVLQEASEAIDRFAGYGQGFAGHMLTFGQSLIELADSGHEEYAEGCRTAFCKYVTVTRQGPQPGDRKIAPHRPSELRPEVAEYWNKRGDHTLGLGHVFKYPYAYYDLVARADDAELAEKLDAKAWRIF